MRRRALVGTLTAAAALALSALAWAAVSKPFKTADPKGDVSAAPDIQRLSLARASDGRLRAVITFAAPLQPADLLDRSGPPGSVCLRIWTGAEADPEADRPDRLVCVTARSSRALRAQVLAQRDDGLLRAAGTASVTRNSSRRSLILRVSQSAIGRPQRIRFAAEATRAGCARPACVDTAPQAPATRRFTLR